MRIQQLIQNKSTAITTLNPGDNNATTKTINSSIQLAIQNSAPTSNHQLAENCRNAFKKSFNNIINFFRRLFSCCFSSNQNSSSNSGQAPLAADHTHNLQPGTQLPAEVVQAYRRFVEEKIRDEQLRLPPEQRIPPAKLAQAIERRLSFALRGLEQAIQSQIEQENRID